MMPTLNQLVKLFAVMLVCLATMLQAAQAGGKGKGGGEDDIVMYNGNIVIRGDKKGGSIVMANSQPQREEVEFAPSFFSNFGDIGGFGRRR